MNNKTINIMKFNVNNKKLSFKCALYTKLFQYNMLQCSTRVPNNTKDTGARIEKGKNKYPIICIIYNTFHI